MMVIDNELYEPHASECWRTLAQMSRPHFEAEAEGLLAPKGAFAVMRKVAAAGG